MRTSVSLIGFGFAIVQVLDRFSQTDGVNPTRSSNFPYVIGLLLIGMGTLSLAIALWQYKLILRHLHSGLFHDISGYEKMPGWSPSMGVAMLLCLIGLIAFMIILTRALRSFDWF
ncbi:MAG: DUF202 domain-containing protein [Nitrospirae bacterium]|nr:DUF202 domain-containing protein [Candidatus Manganitrophaceae bacterium]